MYDVPNDKFFVACLTCGRESTLHTEAIPARKAWREERLSREGEDA
jgi:hypothetical protein